MQDYLETFKNKKVIASLVVLLFLILSIPLAIYLFNSRLNLFSKAAPGDPIELLEGRCVVSVEGKEINCEEVPLKLISPLGPPIQKPNAPQNLKVVSSNCQADNTPKISLSWDKVDGAIGYSIIRHWGDNEGVDVFDLEPDFNTFDDFPATYGINAGTSISYKVVAGKDLQSDPSNEVQTAVQSCDDTHSPTPTPSPTPGVTPTPPVTPTPISDTTFTYGSVGDSFLTGSFENIINLTPGSPSSIGRFDTPAVVRGNQWFLRKSNTTGNADINFLYGEASDQKLLCDWDGDGISTPGVYRGNHFYLKNSNSTGNADNEFIFGNPGMKAVCGDWDGDGKDTVGLIDGNNWFLRNSNSTGFADTSFTFGNATDQFIVGDWDGDGKDTVGAVRSGNDWFLKNSNSTGNADLDFVYGNPGDSPIVGDWNADGKDDVGVVRGNTWFLKGSLASANTSPSKSISKATLTDKLLSLLNFRTQIIEKVYAETHIYEGPSDLTVTAACNGSTPSVKLDFNWRGSGQKAGANGFVMCKNGTVDLDHDSCDGTTIPTSASFDNTGPQTINDGNVQAGQTYSYEWANVDHHSEEFHYWTNCRKITVAACSGSGAPAVSSFDCAGSPPPPTVPECSDTHDNDGDTFIDTNDSGCHTDGNPANSGSFDPNDNSEAGTGTECSDSVDNDGDGGIDGGDPQCHTDGNVNNPESYDPNIPSESPTDANFTVKYRISETETGLQDAQFLPYTQEPIITTYNLIDKNPGAKQIWVEFVDIHNHPQIEHINLTWLAPEPKPTSVSCNFDIAKENVKVTVNGAKFGTTSGRISANGKDIDILEWTDEMITGLIKKPGIKPGDGTRFNISVLLPDGRVLVTAPCEVDTSLIYLGAKLFCREAGKFDVENVKVTLVDEGKSKVTETVAIDKDGVVKNLQSKVQSGKRYGLSIQAPKSLRRNAVFVASSGTTIVTKADGSPFILPVGDIAPVIQADGKINTLDRAELSREWKIFGTSVTLPLGDFNRDTKVNSFDWACMRYDFNAFDDPEITNLTSVCSAAPTCQSGENLVTGDPNPDDQNKCPVYSCVAKAD